MDRRHDDLPSVFQGKIQISSEHFEELQAIKDSIDKGAFSVKRLGAFFDTVINAVVPLQHSYEENLLLEIRFLLFKSFLYPKTMLRFIRNISDFSDSLSEQLCQDTVAYVQQKLAEQYLISSAEKQTSVGES